MSPTSDWQLPEEERRQNQLKRINGGLVAGLVIVGFFLVMLLLLPEAWPVFLLLLGIGASIAFWMESREAQGFPDRTEPVDRAIEADGRARLFGPDLQIQLRPSVTGHPVGVVLIIGFALILLGRVPIFLPFLLGAVALGGLVGLVLWWKHR